MPLTHSQTPVHVCVCLWREFVWSSQLVCISVWQRLCVCVCVWLCGQCVTAGQPLNRPPAALKHWNSLPCSFFFFFSLTCCLLHSVPMKLARLWLVQIACTVNGFSGVCQGADGGRFKDRKDTKGDWQIQRCRPAPVAPLNHTNKSYCWFMLKWNPIHHN